MVVLKEKRHTDIWNRIVSFFFPRIHTKKYQLSFQGVHLKNNGNLKCGQFLKFKKQTCM